VFDFYRDLKMSESNFQDRVMPWLLECFGAEIAGNKVEQIRAKQAAKPRGSALPIPQEK
jgi:hypothetical protein